MREKLLHERLRDCDGSCCSEIFRNINGTDCSYGVGCSTCTKEMFNYIADEIERGYIALPRDKRGEVWHIGDAVVGDDGEKDRIVKFDFDEAGLWRAMLDGPYYKWTPTCLLERWVEPEKTVEEELQAVRDELFEAYERGGCDAKALDDFSHRIDIALCRMHEAKGV